MSICVGPAAWVRGRGETTPGSCGAFLVAVFADGPVEVGEIAATDVVGFVAGLTRRWRPRTVEGAATALRSFFRFLRAAGSA